MTDPFSKDPDESAASLDPAADRYAQSEARKHVGAAGFAQLQALEQIITAGREQLAICSALRQVISVTLAQVRETAPHEQEEASPHIEALRETKRAAQRQLRAAEELRWLIHRALQEVRSTPLEHMSARVLGSLHDSVMHQANDLAQIVTTAIEQAETDEQVADLERINVTAATQIEALENKVPTAFEEQSHMKQPAGESLHDVADLEGQLLAFREHVKQLQGQARDDAEQMNTLRAQQHQASSERLRFEHAEDISSMRIDELTRAAEASQARITEMRQQLETRQHTSESPTERTEERDSDVPST